MNLCYSIQIDGQEEEMFDIIETFDHRARAIIYSKSISSFRIRDYVFSEVYPTTILFKRNDGGFFDISIEKEDQSDK